MLDDESVVRVLMQANVLTPFRLNQARRLQRKANAPLYDVLLEHRLVDETKALQAISSHMSTPCVSLGDFEGDANLLDRVPRQLAEAYRVLPVGLMSEEGIERLFLAMADPTDLAAMETISQATGFDVEPVLVGPSDLRGAILRCYGGNGADVTHDDDTEDPVPAGPAEQTAPSNDDFGDIGEWDHLELDGEADEYLRDLLDDSAGPTSKLELGPVPIRQEKSQRATEVLDSRMPEQLGFSANSFREFMTKSAVAILTPLDSADIIPPRETQEVGSKDLLRAVVRILIQRGIITEKELMDMLAELRRRHLLRGDR